MRKILAVGLFLLVAGSAWAYDATIELTITEATFNVDGSPLDDLASSLVEIRNAQDELLVGPDSIAATNPNGGGTIVKQYTLPVSDTKSESYSAVVWHVDTSGNQSAGLGINFMAGGSDPPPTDTTPPDPPQNLQLANLGVAPMPFPTTSILDNFTRANGGVGSNWTGGPYGFGDPTHTIISNAIYNGGGGGYSDAVWNVSQPGPNSEVFATIGTVGGNGTSFALYNRYTNIGGSGVDGYALYVEKLAGTDTVKLFRTDNQSDTQLGATVNLEFANGDSFGLEIIGSTIKGYRKPSGGSWTEIISRTDSTYSGAGYIGCAIQGSTWRIDDFGGGTVVEDSEEYSGSSELFGSGSLVATGEKGAEGVAVVEGSGATTATGEKGAEGVGVVEGSGSLATVGIVAESYNGSALLSGSGVITATGEKGAEGVALVDGSGAITATGEKGAEGVAVVEGSGAITATGEKGAEGVAVVEGSGSLSIVGIVAESYSKSVLLSGSGSLVATGEKGTEGVGVVEGSGVISATGEKGTEGVGVVEGSGAITATDEKGAEGVAVVNGSGAIATSATTGEAYSGSALLSGSGSLVATGEKGAKGVGVVEGSGTLESFGLKKIGGEVSLSGGGYISLAALKKVSGLAALNGSGDLVVVGGLIIAEDGYILRVTNQQLFIPSVSNESLYIPSVSNESLYSPSVSNETITT